jgi:hypothetical protein
MAVQNVFVAAPVADEGVVIGDLGGEGGVEFGEGGVDDPHEVLMKKTAIVRP